MAVKKTKSFKDKLNRALSTIKSPTFNMGFARNDLFVSTGNFALNWRLSGRFDRGYCFGRSVIVGGEPGSGKSLHTAYTCAQAQKQLGAHIIWMDVEKASSEEWLAACGLDMENVTYMRAGTVTDAKEMLALLCAQAREAEKEFAEGGDEPQPVVIVIDSYSAFMTESEYEKAVKGENVGDMGQLAQQIGRLVKQATHLTDGLPVLVIGMVHIYYNQDGFGEKEKLTGGIKTLYMASYSIKMNKYKLTAEDMKEKGSKEELRQVRGIKSVVEIQKSRFSKPFEKITIEVPYATGMDSYSGLFDIMKTLGIIYTPTNPETGKQSVGWWTYKGADGNPVKNFRESEFVSAGHADLCMTLVNEDDSTPVGVGMDVNVEDLEETDEI